MAYLNSAAKAAKAAIALKAQLAANAQMQNDIALIAGIAAELHSPMRINGAMLLNNGQASIAAQRALNCQNWHKLAILALSQLQ